MKRLFAVDDSASFRLYLDKVLTQMDYIVDFADDGDTALDKLVDYEAPLDVFIIDVVMRRMDGFTLIRHIREIDRFKNTPVIVLTNFDDVHMIEEAKAAGANCWISKPFDAGQIADVIEALTA